MAMALSLEQLHQNEEFRATLLLIHGVGSNCKYVMK